LLIHSLIFAPYFPLVDVHGGSSPMTQNTSWSTTTSNSSAGSTLRQDQARLEMQSLHLFSSVYFCILTKHRILHQEYRDRKRRP